MKVEEIIQTIIKMCNEFQAKEVILYGSRAKGTARERRLFFSNFVSQI